MVDGKIVLDGPEEVTEEMLGDGELYIQAGKLVNL